MLLEPSDNGAPQGSIPKQTIVNPQQFADDTNLCGVADTSEGCAAFQRERDKLGKQEPLQFNKEKCHPVRITSGTSADWEAAPQRRS